MSKIYLHIVEDLLKNIRHDSYNKRRVLAKKNIAVEKWVKIDEYFSDVIIKTAGEDEVIRYANQALKAQVENLMPSRLNKCAEIV
ncbi:aconitate hydratase [Lysinibacillus xylanilyticus]|nr:aconitate hydratase [Lysinibacillus xylanilyticus]